MSTDRKSCVACPQGAAHVGAPRLQVPTAAQAEKQHEAEGRGDGPRLVRKQVRQGGGLGELDESLGHEPRGRHRRRAAQPLLPVPVQLPQPGARVVPPRSGALLLPLSPTPSPHARGQIARAAPLPESLPLPALSALLPAAVRFARKAAAGRGAGRVARDSVRRGAAPRLSEQGAHQVQQHPRPVRAGVQVQRVRAPPLRRAGRRAAAHHPHETHRPVPAAAAKVSGGTRGAAHFNLRPHEELVFLGGW